MDKSGVFFLFCGRTAGNRIAFRLPYGYNMNKERKTRMQKKTPDYDNVFKTMKMKHKRLFVSVINDVFGRNYPKDVKVEILPSEGYLTENETMDGSKEIEEQVSNFLIRIGSEIYLLECQYQDFQLFMSRGRIGRRKLQRLPLPFQTDRRWIINRTI